MNKTIKSLTFLLLIAVTNACGDGNSIDKEEVIGAWKEVYRGDNPDDTFPVGEILIFNEDGSFEIKSNYLGESLDNEGTWTFDENNPSLTYSYGGDTLFGAPSVEFEIKLELEALHNNTLTVEYFQNKGIAKFFRPKRAYIKID